MDVNGKTLNIPSGFEFVNDQSTTIKPLKRILPNITNDVDIGSTTKRVKTLYYTALDPIPGGGSGGPFLELAGGTMTGALNVGAKVTINAGNDVMGLDLATSNTNASFRVLQNSTSALDKHMYIGYGSGTTSSLFFHSNNILMCTMQGQNVIGSGTIYGRTTQPVVLSKCTSTGSSSLSGATLSGSVFTSPLGSLVYGANTTNLGMTIRTKVLFDVVSYVSGNLTFSLTVNGVTAVTSGTVLSAGNGKLEIESTVRGSNTLQTTIGLFINGQAPKFTRLATVWTTTVSNTIDVLATWSISGNDVVLYQANVEEHYHI